MKRDAVLLLGGHGFIGSALAQRLRSEGDTVHIVGRRDMEQLEALLPLCGTVVHLASSTTPGSSAMRPELEIDNLQLTLRLLSLLHQQPGTHLVFFSSGGTVYGNPAALPVPEDAPLAPLSHHGAAKVAQEAFCQVLRAQSHAVTVLRPSNAYGPGQTLKSGFGLVRTMLEHARMGTALQVWGDGENVRDYVYIDDIVEATMRVIRCPDDRGTYNLGSGLGISVNQIKTLVEQVVGRPMIASYQPARGVDVRSVVLDGRRVAAQFGWQPMVKLSDGIAITCRWLRQTAAFHS
jgi:UDP-glucose 4-epimerase